MSALSRDPNARVSNPEETVINWPAIRAAVGLLVLFVVIFAISWNWLSHRVSRLPQAKADALMVVIVESKPSVAGRAVLIPRHQDAANTNNAEPAEMTEGRLVKRERSEVPKILKQERRPAITVNAEASSVIKLPLSLGASAAKLQRPDPPLEPTFKRRDLRRDHELSELLMANVSEVDLDAVPGTAKNLWSAARTTDKKEKKETSKNSALAASSAALPAQAVLELFATRSDLHGLLLRQGADCQLTKVELQYVRFYSNQVREINSALRRQVRSSADLSEAYREPKLANLLADVNTAEDDAVNTLLQMFQTEDEFVRTNLVRTLAKIKGPKASSALANRALFDISSDIREFAVETLRERPPQEWRPQLLQGLRYPLPAVAEHAAEALVHLADREAARMLVDLLDNPDPAAPVLNKEEKWVRAEVVRVNHMRNCLLCHAPSFDSKDVVRGRVPEIGKPIPEEYYASHDGDFVRADIVYLKQDFSVMQPVADHSPWPKMQRFDYLVRMTPLSEEELAEREALAKDAKESATYPQREAVLFALRELTGMDVGNTSAAWLQVVED